MATNNTDQEELGAYARTQVPMSARGPAYPIFLIVAGSLCGIPIFILACDLAGKMGLLSASVAFVCGAIMSGVLGALGAKAGSKTGLNMSLLAERTFGMIGSAALKLVLALCLMGWFTVICSVMGVTSSSILQKAWGVNVNPLLISGAIIVLVGIITARGVKGLESVGMVILPLTIVLLGYALFHSFPLTLGAHDLLPPSLNGTFSSAVSSVVGIYIVGIVIQPDFGRFARVPARAALASGSALAVFYPLMLLAAAIPAIALKSTDLIGALVTLGLAGPALALLLTGALIDSSLSFYSGSLGMANLQRAVGLRAIIIIGCVFAFGLSIVGVHSLFTEFLTLLGIALPPVAIINIIQALWGKDVNVWRSTDPIPAIRIAPCVAWVLGSLGGYVASKGWFTISSIASLDSVIVTGIVMLVIWVSDKAKTPKPALQ